MQTFLIVSTNQQFINEKIDEYKKLWHPSVFNTHEIIPNPSISIEEVRKLKSILTNKTYLGGNRLIIVKDIEKTTLEAANALLKILEEPPKETYILLTAVNENRLLPTILSRCQIIYHLPKISEDNQKIIEQTKKLFYEILSYTPGKRLALSEKLAKNRQFAIEFLDNLTLTLTYLLHHQDQKLGVTLQEIASLINKTIFAKNYLEKYVNVRGVMDIFLLGFPAVNKK